MTGRRRGAALLLAGAVVAAPIVLVTTTAVASRAGFQVAPPDLQILVPTDDISIGTNPDTGDRQLQFTHITWDAGPGPFQIKPRYNRRTGTSIFVQTIFKTRNGSSWRPASRVLLAATGIFDPPSDYRYPLTRFTLNTMNGDGSPGAVVATSPKSDYCITADTFVGGVSNAPNQTSPPQSNCTKPNKALGFSVGWGDEYDQTDNGQPIDLTGVPDGTYILQATVDPQHLFTETDPNNNVVDTELQISGGTVTVINQTQPFTPSPAVALSGLRAGSKVTGTVGLRAPVEASAHATISSVQFLLDGQPIGPLEQSAPYAYTWTVGSASPGPHLLSARATDSQGHMATAAVKAVDVLGPVSARLVSAEDSAPEVTLVNPVAHQVVSGKVPVAVSVRDDVGVRSVQFTLDGRPLGSAVTNAPYALQWETKNVTDGPHTLSALATNDQGVPGTATDVPVTVANPAPPMTCFVLQADVSARGGTTATTPAFHTAAAGETLVAFVSGVGPRATSGLTAVVRGAGLHWRLVTRSTSGAGVSEIWSATAPKVLSAARVSSTLVRPGSHEHLTVIGMEGLDGVGASSSASGATGSPRLALRTSESTSLVFAVATARASGRPTLPAGWVGLNRSIDLGTHSTTWSQYTNQPIGAAGTDVTVKTLAPAGGAWSMAAVELAGDGN